MNQQKEKASPLVILKGAAMGIAEVIPGVSGGTIAFITGIYERLINSIKSLDGKSVSYLLKFKLRSFYNHMDGNFLALLGLGMFIGIGIGVLGVGKLLEMYPAPLWAFFFGLIISSAIYIGRQVDQWNWKTISSLLAGFVIAFGITFISPTEGSDNLLWVFLCGVIAISALILPGISGSFILVLLGMYTVVRGAAEKVMMEQEMASLMIIGAFAVGCVVGLMSFARVLSYAFKNFKNPTLAILTGFMLGSLRKIWPWRNVNSYLDKNSGEVHAYAGNLGNLPEEIQILQEARVLPADYMGDPHTIASIVCFIVGFAIIFGFQYFDKNTK